MSHFTVMVIGADPEKQLAPFSENLEVPRFVEYTKEQLIENGKSSIQSYKNGTYAKYLADKEQYSKDCGNVQHLVYLETEFPKKLNWSDEEVYSDEAKWYEDEDFGENGEVYSERNPNSKWDWFQLGGRWAGVLKVSKETKSAKPNFSWGWSEKEKKEILDGTHTDQAKKKDIINIEELGTFAVLKDGNWYEKGEMGWWAVVTDEMDEKEWDEKQKELVNSLADETLISIYDCHI